MYIIELKHQKDRYNKKYIATNQRIESINAISAFFREAFNQYSNITNSKTKYIHMAMNTSQSHRLKCVVMNINNKPTIKLNRGPKIKTKLILLLESSVFFRNNLTTTNSTITLLKTYNIIIITSDSKNLSYI